MLMMPTTMQDNTFGQDRENKNQQTTGARVMTAMDSNNVGEEGWMTLPETHPGCRYSEDDVYNTGFCWWPA